MKTRMLLAMTLGMLACHGQDEARRPASADEAGPAPVAVAFDAPTHFKSGTRGLAGDVTFTVRMLPKLIVSGPEPEIEQAQIEASRGSEHTTLQLDTRHKQAEWSGIVFELGYADTYHDDIELTVRRKK